MSARPVRLRLGGVPIDPLTMAEAVDAVGALVDARAGGGVFTPNVDHVIECQDNPALRRAYDGVELSLPDGMPVVWAARMLGRHVPAKVSGSDLVPRVVGRAAERGLRLYLLGGADGIAERAAARMVADHPRLVVAGTSSPRVDMAAPPEARRDVVAALRDARADLVLVALGAPKQELFIHEVKAAVAPAVLLGIGASLDFVAGAVRRAPPWMSEHGFEWAYRLAQEPGRLWKRYLVRGPRFVGVVGRDWTSPPRPPSPDRFRHD